MASARAIGDPLLLAARQACRVLVLLVVQADHAKKVEGPMLGLVAAHSEHLDRRFDAVLQCRHVREQVELLKDHADVGPPRAQVLLAGDLQAAVALHVRQRPAVDVDDAFVDGLQRHQHPQHGGLARAGRTDDGHHLVGRHVQVEVVEHRQVPVALADPGEPDHGMPFLQREGVRGLAHRTRLRLHALVVIPLFTLHSALHSGLATPSHRAAAVSSLLSAAARRQGDR